MNKRELSKIIREHKKWVMGEGGSGADLSGAYLSGAYLRGADLRGANLSSAYLSGANLSGADLSSANLSSADLSGADLSGAYLSSADLSSANLSSANLSGTILENINWLAYIGIVPDKRGYAYAYKVTKADGQGIYNGGIDYTKSTEFGVKEVDPDVNIQCSYGINLATFAWCLNNFTDKTYRLFMFRFNVKDAVCPVGSDGKFRVRKCTKVGECSWDGNLQAKD